MADEFAQTVLPVMRAIQAGTTSFASIADALNERGIKSARGGKWHVSSVANVLTLGLAIGDPEVVGTFANYLFQVLHGLSFR